jgi:hypothetical protein
MKRVASYFLILILLVVSLAQCGAQYYCYRDHPVISVLGGCSSSGSSYNSSRKHIKVHRSKSSKESLIMTQMTITHTVTYTVEVEDYVQAGIVEEHIGPDEITLPDDFDIIAQIIPQGEYEELVDRWAWHCIKITNQQIVWSTDQEGSELT